MAAPFEKKVNTTSLGYIAKYKVRGFWSDSTIKVFKTKEFVNGGWNPPQINWSSGGRDREEVESDVEAAECFAKALLDAAELADNLDAESRETP